MLIKIFWKCARAEIEIYTIRKFSKSISGFISPIKITDDLGYLDHWTYHGNKDSRSIMHFKERNGHVSNNLSSRGINIKDFDNFKGNWVECCGYAANFSILEKTINIEGHPEQEDVKIVFEIQNLERNNQRCINVDLIDCENIKKLTKESLNWKKSYQKIIDYKIINDGEQPAILISFGKYKNNKNTIT